MNQHTTSATLNAIPTYASQDTGMLSSMSSMMQRQMLDLMNLLKSIIEIKKVTEGPTLKAHGAEGIQDFAKHT